MCYGAAWEPTTSATKMYVSKTVRPLTRVPSEHPLYEAAYAKACLTASWNTSAPTEDDQREQRAVLVERAGSVRDDADRERGAIVL